MGARAPGARSVASTPGRPISLTRPSAVPTWRWQGRGVGWVGGPVGCCRLPQARRLATGAHTPPLPHPHTRTTPHRQQTLHRVVAECVPLWEARATAKYGLHRRRRQQVGRHAPLPPELADRVLQLAAKVHIRLPHVGAGRWRCHRAGGRDRVRRGRRASARAPRVLCWSWWWPRHSLPHMRGPGAGTGAADQMRAPRDGGGAPWHPPQMRQVWAWGVQQVEGAREGARVVSCARITHVTTGARSQAPCHSSLFSNSTRRTPSRRRWTQQQRALPGRVPPPGAASGPAAAAGGAGPSRGLPPPPSTREPIRCSTRPAASAARLRRRRCPTCAPFAPTRPLCCTGGRGGGGGRGPDRGDRAVAARAAAGDAAPAPPAHTLRHLPAHALRCRSDAVEQHSGGSPRNRGGKTRAAGTANGLAMSDGEEHPGLSAT